MTCPCQKAIPARGDPAGRSIQALSGIRKKKRKSSHGKGKFCVISPKGKKVRCFQKKTSAQRVARGFSKKSRRKYKVRASR